MDYLRDIEKLITKKIQVVKDHPYPLVDFEPVKAVKQQRGSHNRPGSGTRRTLIPDRRNMRR
jgi:ATP-dependent RNA helicase RhlE